jgi:hypothetical protein
MNNSILAQSQILQDFQTDNQTIQSQINQNISISQEQLDKSKNKNK